MDAANLRLEKALPSLAFFAGGVPVIGGAIPAIAMPMHMGLDAQSCEISDPVSGRRAFAKVFHAGALDPFPFQGAIEGASRAHEAGLSPALLAWDEAPELLLFEHLSSEWRMSLAPDFRNLEMKISVIAAKKSWHGQALLSMSRSPFDVARHYIERLEPHLSASHADALVFKGIFPFRVLKDWIFMIEAALIAAGTDSAPTQGENNVSNIMIGPAGKIQLVDFDRAVNADPLYDIGGLCLDLCRNDAERMEVVEIYAGAFDPAILARIKLYGLVDDFVWGCWALLSELNPAMRGPEFYKYGNNRFVRLCHHLQTFDIGTLLGKI